MPKRLIPITLSAALFASILMAVLSIHQLQGSARVINYAGVVRGATQRLIKQELNGQQNDGLMDRLDGILAELSTGRGENGLERMEDSDFQALVGRLQEEWAVIKGEIVQVRQGGDSKALYTDSEAFFELADRTVSAAERYSEHQVRRAEQGLLILGAVFLLLSALLAWYGAMQGRRRRALQEAEEINRAKSENLERMSADLRAPLDAISELMYVADLENHELLFINEAGRRTFGIAELRGQKCYEVLYGLSAPCAFCSTPALVPGENYTWEHTNPITGRHYLLKDRLLRWEGRPARIQIAFDITEAEAEKQELKNTLDAEKIVIECVQTLYREHDFIQSFPMVLAFLGKFLSADRVHLLMVRGEQLCCDFEWCGQGVPPVKDFLQEIPLAAADDWRQLEDGQGCVVLEDADSLEREYPELRARLRKAQIRSMLTTPLEQDGTLQGLLVVHNAMAAGIQGMGPMLRTLGYFLMLSCERTESEQQLSHLSYYDTLTSFYNRNRYMKDSAALTGYPGPLGIVYLDVNGLKDINDKLGHAAGDETLVECARQMRAAFRNADFYRIGGDEFVILCPGIDQETFEARTAVLRRYFDNNDLCRAAVGARWTTKVQDVQQIIADADANMYEDKKEFYRRNPASNRYRHLSDEVLYLSDPEVLREEIRQDRFVVYLQPKLSSSKRSAVGAEALIRYQSRSGSLMLPGNFLPMLEESRTISQIDFYVFEYACSRLRAWSEQGRQTLPIAVNFSRCSLSQPDFIARLTALCRKYNVEKKYLEIELTETAHEAGGVDLKALIRDLRQAGFVVSIDDFGTEYANLSLLSTIEFDVLKLDKSLVDDVAISDKARIVVENIVNICREMGIQVVAEGIETEEQLEALRSCGVELVQGYLFSKPIPIEEYERTYL